MKKKFFSKYRTLEHAQYKSAATKHTFAATFCSIIIETRPTEDILQRRTNQV